MLLFIVSLFAAAFIRAGAFVFSLDLWFYDKHIVNIFELIYCGGCHSAAYLLLRFLSSVRTFKLRSCSQFIVFLLVCPSLFSSFSCQSITQYKTGSFRVKSTKFQKLPPPNCFDFANIFFLKKDKHVK